jgi:hypothetical protein
MAIRATSSLVRGVVRSIDELTSVQDPVWSGMLEAVAASLSPVEVLPVQDSEGADTLRRLQVTTRSCLGALAFHTGGVLVDHGWVRVLGGGHTDRRLPGLANANGLPPDPAEVTGPPPSLLVGFDVLGGQFAVNGPAPASLGRPGQPGQLCYFAPDTLEWEAMEIGGHTAWFHWLLSGRLDRFYEGLRWTGWQSDIAEMPLDQGMSVYPFLSTEEAQRDINQTSRKPVPISELFSFYGGDRLLG